MPATNQSDINVLSPENSAHGINLGPNGFFNGQIIDVSDYTTVTVTAAGTVPPNATDALQIEWYDSDNVFVSLSFIGSGAQTFQTLHQGIRTAKMRVRYHAAITGQTNLHIDTLLRKGNISGSVTPIGQITGQPDAQIVNGIMMARTATGTWVPATASADAPNPHLIITHPPNRTTRAFIRTAASLASVQIDVAGTAAPTRRFTTIFNDTVRGNLFIKLGVAASMTNWEWKVPPQHLWTLPESWPPYGGAGGTIFGIWDVADGFAHTIEAF